jgi:hypothetical protein
MWYKFLAKIWKFENIKNYFFCDWMFCVYLVKNIVDHSLLTIFLSLLNSWNWIAKSWKRLKRTFLRTTLLEKRHSKQRRFKFEYIWDVRSLKFHLRSFSEDQQKNSSQSNKAKLIWPLFWGSTIQKLLYMYWIGF